MTSRKCPIAIFAKKLQFGMTFNRNSEEWECWIKLPDEFDGVLGGLWRQRNFMDYESRASAYDWIENVWDDVNRGRLLEYAA